MSASPAVPSAPLGPLFTAEAVLDMLPGGVLVLDEQYRVRSVNQQAARWCNSTTAALLGRAVPDLPLPAGVRATLRQLLEPANAAPGQLYLAQTDQWILVSVIRQPEGWVLHGQDSTPQKRWEQRYQALTTELAERKGVAVEQGQAQEAQRASEEQYRTHLEQQVRERTHQLKQSRDLLQATMDSSTDMIQVFEAVRDEKGRIVDFRWLLNNHTSEHRYGEVRGQSLLERNPGVVPEGIFADFVHAVETGESRHAERYYGHEQFDGWFLQSVVKLGDGVATSTKEITEWKRGQAEVLRLRDEVAQARLRESEDKYRELVDFIPAAVYACHPDATLAYCNARAVELWGGQPGPTDTAWVLCGARRTYLPDGTPLHPAESPLARVLATGQPVVNQELRMARPDASCVDVLVNITALLDAAGQVVGAVSIFQDITASKQAQQQLAELAAQLEQRVARRTQALQASRDLLQSMFDTNLMAMSVLEAVRDGNGVVQDFRLRLVNRELERETGRTDLVGKLYAQEYPGIRETGLFELAVRALETGEPQGMEYYYLHEGFDKWFACQFVKLGDGVVATNLDITTRKRAEQERLNNLRLLEQAEAVAGLGSWDYNRSAGTLRWSDGMYELFGLPLGQPVAPRIYLEYVVADDRGRAEHFLRQLTAGTEGFEQTLRLRIAGEVKTVRLKAVILPNEQGQAGRVLGVDLDISALQRLEADNLRLRLRQQHALFEAVQAAQEEERKRMAENLHNGIGQLLYATKLRLDQLHAPTQNTAPALVVARQETDRLLAEAIRQTRALSHELVPMVLQDFGLVAALQDISRKMSTPQLHFTCQVLLDDEAAPLAQALRTALYRMAQELAQNIVKHARGATEASLEIETTPGWVLLRAEDNGPGFTQNPAAGNGLGLRSIRDRVALLEGQLEVGALPAGGAYVRIRIPLFLFPAPL